MPYPTRAREPKRIFSSTSLDCLNLHDRVNFPRRRAPRMMEAVLAEILDSRTHVCASVVVVIP